MASRNNANAAPSGRGSPRPAATSVDTLIGVRLTVVLGRLLVLDDVRLSGADAEAVWGAVMATTADLSPGAHRVRVRQGLYVAVHAYLRRHLPGPGWTFVGSDVRVGGLRADLVWRTADRSAVRIDEIKLVVPGGPLTEALLRQLASYARAYAATGECRVEIRLVTIAHPERSRTFAAAELAARGTHPLAAPGALA